MIVNDKSASTGMFSKAGRQAIEMFTLLQEKERVMDITNSATTDIKKRKPNIPLSQQKHSIPSLNPISTPLEMPRSFFLSKNRKKQNREEQPFNKNIPREYFDNIQSKQVNNGKFGMYNAKHHFIFEKSSLYEDPEFVNENKKRVNAFRDRVFGDHGNSLKKLNTYLSQKRIQQKQQQYNNNSQFANNSSQNYNNNNNMTIQSAYIQQNQSQIVQNSPRHNHTVSLPTIDNDRSIMTNYNDYSILNDSSLYGIDYDKPKRKVPGHIQFSKMVPAQGYQHHY